MCTHTHIHMRACMCALVCQQQSLTAKSKIPLAEKEEKYRKLHALEIHLTSVLKQTTRLYSVTIIGMYLLN